MGNRIEVKDNKVVITLIVAIITVILGIIVLIQIQQINTREEIVIHSDESSQSELGEKPRETIKVDIQGEVKNPGVYEFEEGMVIDDALKKAGGLSKEADLEYIEKNINRAEKLTDQQKIYIPAYGENNQDSDGGNSRDQVLSGSVESGKININTASIGELDSLPGIGPSYAQSIIDGRPYSSIEGIKSIKGIGDATYEKIKDLITV